MRKKNIILTTAILLIAGCANKEQQEAQALLQRATQAYQHQEYSKAKLQLDSIRELYPKEFDTRKQAIRLHQRIELDETRIGLHYIDSSLTTARANIKPLTQGLKLDKDPRYEEIGHYYSPRHSTEKNVGRSYMRPQTSEKGTSSLIVFHHGKPIEAHTLRISTNNDSYVELKASEPAYATSNAMGRTERVDFPTEGLDNAANFLASLNGKSVKVTLVGNKGKATLPLSKADSEILMQVSRLGSVIRTVKQLEKQQDELKRQIEFISNRMSNDSVK